MQGYYQEWVLVDWLVGFFFPHLSVNTLRNRNSITFLRRENFVLGLRSRTIFPEQIFQNVEIMIDFFKPAHLKVGFGEEGWSHILSGLQTLFALCPIYSLSI